MAVLCSTDRALALFGIACNDGILYFPVDPKAELPGILIDVQREKSITPQLEACIRKELGEELSQDEIKTWPEHGETMHDSRGNLLTVFVSLITPNSEELPEPKEHWHKMPDIIRSLPRDRKRVTYMRAWQILVGAYEGHGF